MGMEWPSELVVLLVKCTVYVHQSLNPRFTIELEYS